MREAGLVQIGGTRQGLGAIDRIGRYMMAQTVPDIGQLSRARAARRRARAKAGRRTINEYDAKRLLSAFGVPVTREHRVATLAEATQADARDRLPRRAQGGLG